MSNDAIIDQLVSDYNSRKHPKQGERKGTNALKAQEQKPSGNQPAMVEAGTRAYNVARMLQEGKDIYEIAQAYGITDKTVRQIISEGLSDLIEQTAPIFLNYTIISMNRLERLMERLEPHLFNNDPSISDEDDESLFSEIGAPNLAVIDEYRSIMKQERELVDMALPKGKGDNGRDKNPLETFLGTDPLYIEGSKALHDHYNGEETEREQDIAHLDSVFQNGIGSK